MKLPDLIKLGVEKEDWNLICLAYEAITGEKLAPPPPKAKEPDLLTLDINPELLSKLGIDSSLPESDGPSISDEQEREEEQPQKKNEEDHVNSLENYISQAKRTNNVFVRKNDDNKTEARKEPIVIPSVRQNRFVDDLSVEAADLKENNPVLKQVYDKVKHGKSRALIEDAVDTGGQVPVVCSLCGKNEVVSTLLSRGYNPNPEENVYRCNSCSTPSGRARAGRAIREQEMAGISSRRKR